MIRDFRRSFAFYFQNPAELPHQMGAWWGTQDFESQLAIGGLLAFAALYGLVYLRPAAGSLLAFLFPYGWINTDGMRSLFFRGTRAEFEKSWRSAGQPTRNRMRYLVDAFYYCGPVLVAAIAMAVAFITLVGYPGYGYLGFTG